MTNEVSGEGMCYLYVHLEDIFLSENLEAIPVQTNVITVNHFIFE